MSQNFTNLSNPAKATVCKAAADCSTFGDGSCCMQETQFGNRTKKTAYQIAESAVWDNAGYIVPKNATFMQWCYDKANVDDIMNSQKISANATSNTTFYDEPTGEYFNMFCIGGERFKASNVAAKFVLGVATMVSVAMSF